jgi:hypothetical protein
MRRQRNLARVIRRHGHLKHRGAGTVNFENRKDGIATAQRIFQHRFRNGHGLARMETGIFGDVLGQRGKKITNSEARSLRSGSTRSKRTQVAGRHGLSQGLGRIGRLEKKAVGKGGITWRLADHGKGGRCLWI